MTAPKLTEAQRLLAAWVRNFDRQDCSHGEWLEHQERCAREARALLESTAAGRAALRGES